MQDCEARGTACFDGDVVAEFGVEGDGARDGLDED